MQRGRNRRKISINLYLADLRISVCLALLEGRPCRDVVMSYCCSEGMHERVGVWVLPRTNAHTLAVCAAQELLSDRRRLGWARRRVSAAFGRDPVEAGVEFSHGFL